MEVPKMYLYPCAVYTLLMILGTNDQNTCLEYEQVLPSFLYLAKWGSSCSGFVFQHQCKFDLKRKLPSAINFQHSLNENAIYPIVLDRYLV